MQRQLGGGRAGVCPEILTTTRCSQPRGLFCRPACPLCSSARFRPGGRETVRLVKVRAGASCTRRLRLVYGLSSLKKKAARFPRNVAARLRRGDARAEADSEAWPGSLHRSWRSQSRADGLLTRLQVPVPEHWARLPCGSFEMTVRPPCVAPSPAQAGGRPVSGGEVTGPCGLRARSAVRAGEAGGCAHRTPWGHSE